MIFFLVNCEVTAYEVTALYLLLMEMASDGKTKFQFFLEVAAVNTLGSFKIIGHYLPRPRLQCLEIFLNGNVLLMMR